jgi:Protein of unknown function (DUF2490)
MNIKRISIFFLILIAAHSARSQKTVYNQFWNEYAFTHTFKGKIGIELNFGQTWTSTPESKNIFTVNSQVYARGWLHYYASARWKLSYFFAYFYNKYVPEIDQREYPEMRQAMQAVYYIHKVNYTLLTRFRLEDRHILNNAGYYEGVYRLRGQIKGVLPLNNKIIRKGVFYALASDELFVKSISKVTGLAFFDRNRLTMGGGYSITDDVQVELTYANEILPRSPVNEIYNALQINFSFNNLFENIGKKLLGRRNEVKAAEGTDD